METNHNAANRTVCNSGRATRASSQIEMITPHTTDLFAAVPEDTSTSQRPIEDAGVKIGGARKDLWKERGLIVSDLKTMLPAEAVKFVTKEHAWPRDYAAMIEAGADSEAVALVKLLCDKLAARPRINTPQGLINYVTMMEAVRDVLGAAKSVAEVKAAEKAIAARVGYTLRSSLRTPEHLAAKQVFFSIFRGYSTLRVSSNDEAAARRLVEEGFPNAHPWHTQFEVREDGGYGTTERGVELITEAAAELGTPITAAQALAGVYKVLRKATKRTVAYALTEKAAAEAALAAYERQKTAEHTKGYKPNRPHIDEVIRYGLPPRRTRDVRSEDFLTDFGFRGIEFGNWAMNDERQGLINLAYDALVDSAEVLGIPPRALSFNGKLGIAFGARGSGAALAHYESSRVVINMTKINGAGSLMHELGGHALDHYFGELNRPDAYATLPRGATGWHDLPTGVTNDNLRPELRAAWQGVMRAILERDVTRTEKLAMSEAELKQRTDSLARTKKQLKTWEAQHEGERDDKYVRQLRQSVETQAEVLKTLQESHDTLCSSPDQPGSYGRCSTAYYLNALRLCGKKGEDGTWTRPTELWARAVESYAFDKLAERGALSQYLVHGVEPDRFADPRYKGNPYPAEDRPAINAAIQKLVDTLKIQDGENGLPILY